MVSVSSSTAFGIRCVTTHSNTHINIHTSERYRNNANISIFKCEIVCLSIFYFQLKIVNEFGNALALNPVG